jgi:hypothetical protein
MRYLLDALRILFAILHTVLYAFAALVAAGGGHGTVFPLFPLVTWIFYLAAFVILDKFGGLTFYILMALHYSHFLLILWALASYGLDPNEKKYWHDYPDVVVFTVLLYLAGQVAVWVAFLRFGSHKLKSAEQRK